MQDLHPVTRRYWLALCAALVPSFAPAQPRLGDDEWMKRFRDFVKSFNEFVNALNDGSFDVSRWRRTQTDWKKLDGQ
jgi:hypothetical protein